MMIADIAWNLNAGDEPSCWLLEKSIRVYRFECPLKTYAIISGFFNSTSSFSFFVTKLHGSKWKSNAFENRSRKCRPGQSDGSFESLYRNNLSDVVRICGGCLVHDKVPNGVDLEWISCRVRKAIVVVFAWTSHLISRIYVVAPQVTLDVSGSGLKRHVIQCRRMWHALCVDIPSRQRLHRWLHLDQCQRLFYNRRLHL